MKRNLKNIRDYHETIFNKLGISSEGRIYEDMVEQLIHAHLQLSKEIEMNNKELFKRDFLRISKERTN